MAGTGDELLYGLNARSLKSYLDTAVIDDNFLIPTCLHDAHTPENKAGADALARILDEAGGKKYK